MPWYRHRAAWRWIAFGYLPWFAALNLAWETAQLPLYTLWHEEQAGYIAFAVAHCTAGDTMIGAATLSLALIATRAGLLSRWRWLRIAVIAALAGTGYTAFSEWMNTSLKASWEYSELMPTLTVDGIALGISPLAQWLLLPPLALLLARAASRSSCCWSAESTGEARPS